MMRSRILERLLWIAGVVCLLSAGATSLRAWLVQREQQVLLDAVLARSARTDGGDDDLAAPASRLVGRITIPRLDLSAIVLTGDDEATLHVAVGHLPDTPLPWDGGNSALAGHRDTFFKPLERVHIGDDVHLETPRGRFQYRVRRVLVVEPEDVWVLAPTAHPTLTLITCYPFAYVGPAPRRFVVQAERVAVL